MKKVSLLITLILLSSCATAPTTMYNMEEYSNILYSYRKDGSDASREKFTNNIDQIIERNTKRNIKIAPGLYLERGYYAKKMGNDSLAQTYFEKELQLYPQSKKMIDVINNKNKIGEE